MPRRYVRLFWLLVSLTWLALIAALVNAGFTPDYWLLHRLEGVEPRYPRTGLRRVLPAAPVPPNHQQPRAALDVDVDVARRRRTTARQRGPSTSSPIGQLTPVPPMPQ